MGTRLGALASLRRRLELGLQRGLALAGGRVRGVDLGAQLVLALLSLGQRRVQRVLLGGEAGDLVLRGPAVLHARSQFGLALMALGQGCLDLAEAIDEICFAWPRCRRRARARRDARRWSCRCCRLRRGDRERRELGLQGGDVDLGGIGALGDGLEAGLDPLLGAGRALALLDARP